MKILMLNYEFPPIGGGAANAHLCLLKQYAGYEDLQVDVLTSAPNPGNTTEKFSENISIHKIGIHKKQLHHWRRTEVIEWLFKAGFQYRQLLSEKTYDIAHAFFGFPTGWLCYRRAERLPYIISLRGSDVPGEHGRLKLDYKVLAPVFRKIWRKATALVACSNGLKDRALQFMPSAFIDVIPNGVELDKFYPAQAKVEQDKLRLLTVGRLSVIKRIEMLIDAIAILHKNGHKLHMTIVGGGPMEQQLKQIALQEGLSDLVEFMGRINPEEIPDIYRKNDIFISASIQEGMSNAMLEAMASGLPIITTRCEGVEELITDNGRVIERSSAEEVANAIQKLSTDHKSRKQMALAARNNAERFTWSRSAEDYVNLYKKLI
jgi:glycosyltransferase involved in cell wall biosynthesis